MDIILEIVDIEIIIKVIQIVDHHLRKVSENIKNINIIQIPQAQVKDIKKRQKSIIENHQIQDLILLNQFLRIDPDQRKNYNLSQYRNLDQIQILTLIISIRKTYIKHNHSLKKLITLIYLIRIKSKKIYKSIFN